MHPESYAAAHAIIAAATTNDDDDNDDYLTDDGANVRPAVLARLKAINAEDAVDAVAAATPPLNILDARMLLDALIAGPRDPRTVRAPVFRAGVRDLADVRVGETLRGYVTNVLDFGAFVDVGVGDDGLLHQSEFPSHDPYLVGLGEEVEVKVLDVNQVTRRIALAFSAAARARMGLSTRDGGDNA